MRGIPRAVQASLVTCAALSVVIFSGVFDLLVTRGEKYYLWQQAEATLARAPRASLDDIMTRTIHDAVFTAALWARFVFIVSTGAVLFTWRRLTAPPRS